MHLLQQPIAETQLLQSRAQFRFLCCHNCISFCCHPSGFESRCVQLLTVPSTWFLWPVTQPLPRNGTGWGVQISLSLTKYKRQMFWISHCQQNMGFLLKFHALSLGLSLLSSKVSGHRGPFYNLSFPCLGFCHSTSLEYSYPFPPLISYLLNSSINNSSSLNNWHLLSPYYVPDTVQLFYLILTILLLPFYN